MGMVLLCLLCRGLSGEMVTRGGLLWGCFSRFVSDRKSTPEGFSAQHDFNLEIPAVTQEKYSTHAGTLEPLKTSRAQKIAQQLLQSRSTFAIQFVVRIHFPHYSN